jgi:hypothetical protein
MNDDLDRMIPGEEIVPSSGFVASVMEALHQEAAAPQPIAFPWGRALPGLLALGAVFVVLIAAAIRMISMPDSSDGSLVLLASWAHVLLRANAGWIAFALLLTFCSILFSIRLTREQA